MASTELICPVDPTDVQLCWLFGLNGCVLALWYLDEPGALLWVAAYPGEASAASTKTRLQTRTRRMNFL